MGLFRLQQLTAPAYEPLALTQVKDQLRIASTDQDLVLTALITAARTVAEVYLRRSLVRQQWLLTFDRFPGSWPFSYGFGSSLISPYREIHLPRSPLVSVDSFQYIEMNSGQLQDITGASVGVGTADEIGYQVGYAEPGRLQPLYGAAWPIARWVVDAVQIKFTAGYQDTSQSPIVLNNAIPEPILLAMKLMIGHFYENRESQEMPPAAEQLLFPWRVWDVAPVLNNWERFGR